MPTIKLPASRSVEIFGRQVRVLDLALFISLLAVVALVYGALTWVHELNEFGGDSAAYLLISRMYSPYHAASATVEAYKSQIISPPLFPFMLALVDGGYHFLLAHLLVGVFACASVMALFLWLRKESVSPPQSMLIALLWAWMPANLLYVFNIWTEYPYLFCSLSTALLMSSISQADSQKKWVLAAVFVACACLIRAAALPLLVAYLVFLAIKRPRNAIVLALIAGLPFAVWAAYSGHSEQGGGSYVKQLADMYGTDTLNKLIRQVTVEYASIRSAWEAGWLGNSHSAVLRGMVWGFWWISIAGWIYRLIKLRFDAIYLGLYLLQLFAWAHPEEASRYALVTYPILAASGFLLLYKLVAVLREAASAKYIPVAAILVLATAMIPSWIFIMQRFTEDVPSEVSAAKHTDYWYAENHWIASQNAQFQTKLIQHLKEIPKYVPANACIFAIKPTIVSLYADRPSFTPPKIAEDSAAFDAGIRKCHYAYVFSFSSPSYGAPYYPLGRLGERGKILSNFLDNAGQMDGGLVEITP